MINVNFYTTLRLYLKRKELSLNEKEISVRALLEKCQAKTPKKFMQKLIDENGEMKQGTIILINGQNVHHLDKLDTIVKDGDKVALFPPGGGG